MLRDQFNSLLSMIKFRNFFCLNLIIKNIFDFLVYCIFCFCRKWKEIVEKIFIDKQFSDFKFLNLIGKRKECNFEFQNKYCFYLFYYLKDMEIFVLEGFLNFEGFFLCLVSYV